MTTAPDTKFVTGEVFEQLNASEILITPTGGSQTTLADALAASSGTMTKVTVAGGPLLTANTITIAGTISGSASSFTNHGVLLGQGISAIAATATLSAGQILVGQAGADPVPRTMSGDATLDNTGALGLVASGVVPGIYGTATKSAQIEVDAAGRVIDAANVTISGVAPAGAAGGDLGGTYPNPTVLSVANVNTGRLAFANFNTLAASSLFGNGATVAGNGANIAIGSGLSLSVGNVLTASGSGGSVTLVEAAAGPFLNAASITASGTISNSVASLLASGLILGSGTAAVASLGTLGTTTTVLHGNAAGAPTFGAVSLSADVTGLLPFANLATLAASSLFGNGATAGATGTDITIGSGLTLSVGNTLSATGGATAADKGAVLNSGTVQINNSVTLTGTAGGTVTISPTTGTSDVILNMPAGGGTVTVAAAPSFARQRAEIDIKQGATAGIVTLNSGFVFGTSGGPTSYTATPTANAVDRLMMLSPDGTKWAVLAINQGFTL